MDQKLASVKYTGGQLAPLKSEFKRVITRRKSRQSVHAPLNCDIDYIGNTNDYNHLVKNLNLGKDELNFNMNLRSYKNSSNFGPERPWKYPAPKVFSPKA